MSQFPPPHLDPAASSPSFGLPLLATVLASAALFAFPAVMGSQEVSVCCMQNCFSAVCAGILGVFPLLFMRGPNTSLSPGFGLVVPLLGVFIGGVIGAIIQAQFPAFDTDVFRVVAAQGVDDWLQAMEAQGTDTSGLDRGDLIDRMVGLSRYGVLLLAAGSAIVAGGVGLLVGSIASRRRRTDLSG